MARTHSPAGETIGSKGLFRNLFRDAQDLISAVATLETPTPTDILLSRELKDIEKLHDRVAQLHSALLYSTRHARRARLKQLTNTTKQILRRKRDLETTDGMVDAYAKASCRSICNMVQTKLPRELHDMVYEFVLNNSHVAVDQSRDNEPSPCICIACYDVRPAKQDSTVAVTSPPDGTYQIKPFFYWARVPLALQPLHVMNKTYVGHVFVDEPADQCYKKKVFTIHDPVWVESFVERNEVGLINAVDILIGQNVFSPTILRSSDGSRCDRYSTEAITKGLEHLSNLKTTCRIIFRMLVRPSGYNLETEEGGPFFDALRTISEAVMRLRTNGHDICVVASLRDEGMKSSRSTKLESREVAVDWILDVIRIVM